MITSGTVLMAGDAARPPCVQVENQAFPNAWIAEQLTIALPLYPQLPVDDQDRVVDALERAIDG